MAHYIRHFRAALLFLLLIIIIGTVGYHLLEDWTLLDSLYMTVITISTVGYNEISNMHTETRIFTISIILLSICVVGYLIGSLTQILIVGEIATLLGRRRLEKQIQKLKDHIIVCGCGRVGSVICTEFLERGIPFLVIESDPEVLRKIAQEKMLYITNNAVSDDILMEAGIQRAKGLILTLPSDPDNVFITLSARALNSDLFIISRACTETSVKNLYSAGANNVVSPHRMGAARMIYLITQPYVTGFLDSLLHSPDLPLEFGEINVQEETKYAQTTLGQSQIRQEFDLIVVGINKKDGKMIFNPNVSTVIEPGDTLITLGSVENLAKFNAQALSKS